MSEYSKRTIVYLDPIIYPHLISGSRVSFFVSPWLFFVIAQLDHEKTKDDKQDAGC